MSLEIASMLEGGDRRSTGRADEVARIVTDYPESFETLIECLWHEDPVVRMRAADAMEKFTRRHPELLQPHKQELLGLLDEAVRKELRWHLALTVPRLAMTDAERRRAIKTLRRYLDDDSSIVKTFAMQGLADLVRHDARLRAPILEQIRVLTRSGTPAMRARGRKLVRELS